MTKVKCAAFAAMCALLIGSVTSQAKAETVLRYSSFVPATHFMNSGAFLPWADEVAKVTNGRVRIEMTPKVVGTAPGQYDVVRDGLADVAIFVPGYTPGRFDLAGIGEQPMLSDNPVVAAEAFQRLYEKYLADAGLFNEVHVLTAYTVSAGHFFMRDKKVEKVSDLNGMKIRAAVASTIPTLTALGAVPVQKPSTEMYELLSTGALDGTVGGLDQVGAFKLAEVTKHATIVPGGLFNSVLVLAVNKDAWAKISPADQKAITGISGQKLAREVGATFLDPIKKGVETMKEKGNTVETASPEFVAEIEKRVEPVRAAIKEMAKKNGIKDPDEMMSWYLAEIKKLSTK